MRAPGFVREVALAWAGAALVGPRVGPAARRRMATRLARRTLRTLAVRVSRHGALPPPDQPLLVVANHVSWLDVYVLNAFLEARFVAKSETAAWPVVGTISRGFDALHIARGSCRDAARVKDRVAAALGAGERVVVFPEATTTDGSGVRRFHGAMFQAAIDAGVPVLPVALRYRRPDGTVDPTPAFVDDMTFVESLRRVLRASALHAEVTFGSPLAVRGMTRRELAAAAHQFAARTLRVPALAPARPAMRSLVDSSSPAHHAATRIRYAW